MSNGKVPTLTSVKPNARGISTFLDELLRLISCRCLIVIWIAPPLADFTANLSRIDEKAIRISEEITRIDKNLSRLREIRGGTWSLPM